MAIIRSFIVFGPPEEREYEDSGEPIETPQRIVGIGALHEDGHVALNMYPQLLCCQSQAELETFLATIPFITPTPTIPRLVWAESAYDEQPELVYFRSEDGALEASWNRKSGLIAHSLRVLPMADEEVETP